MTSSPTVFISSSIFSTLTRMEPESATVATGAAPSFCVVTAVGAVAGAEATGTDATALTETGAAAIGNTSAFAAAGVSASGEATGATSDPDPSITTALASWGAPF